MSPRARMYALAGRTLANRSADDCCVDREDNWKLYSDDYIADAIAALDAIGADDLLAALIEANDELCDLPLMDPLVVQMRAAIAKATETKA